MAWVRDVCPSFWLLHSHLFFSFIVIRDEAEIGSHNLIQGTEPTWNPNFYWQQEMMIREERGKTDQGSGGRERNKRRRKGGSEETCERHSLWMMVRGGEEGREGDEGFGYIEWWSSLSSSCSVICSHHFCLSSFYKRLFLLTHLIWYSHRLLLSSLKAQLMLTMIHMLMMFISSSREHDDDPLSDTHYSIRVNKRQSLHILRPHPHPIPPLLILLLHNIFSSSHDSLHTF